MSISISPASPRVLVDSVGRTLSFEPRDGSTADPSKLAEWATDSLARLINAGHDSIESALVAVGFKPSDTPTGPQVDARFKRNRQLSQHRAQSGLPASNSTLGLLDRRLLTLTTEGPAAGVSQKVIDEMTERVDLASDQAEASMAISQIERVLVRRGLLAATEAQDAPASAGTPNGPADAPAPAASGTESFEFGDE